MQQVQQKELTNKHVPFSPEFALLSWTAVAKTSANMAAFTVKVAKTVRCLLKGRLDGDS